MSPVPAFDNQLPAPDRSQRAHPLTHADSVTAYGFRVSRQIARCRREGGELALLWMEIDVRQAAGSDATDISDEEHDRLIQLVSLRLRNRVRGTDDVQRVGTSGFAVLMDGGAPEADIVRQRLLQTIRGAYNFDSRLAHVSMRVGTAIFPQAGRNGAELAEAARTALEG